LDSSGSDSEGRRFRDEKAEIKSQKSEVRSQSSEVERLKGTNDRRRVAILANPLAGRGPRGYLVQELADELRRRGLEPAICRQRDELTALVQSDPDALRCVVAAGGDGTLNEVINRAPGIPLSILPLGNENLVARQFGLAASAQKLAEAIELASVRRLDLARLADRYFCLMAGAGIDAAVVHGVHHSRQSHISKRHYAVPTLTSLGSYSFAPIDVEITESGERLRGAAVFLFNMPRYGLGLPIAQSARPDDGRLDLWVFERPGVWNLARYLCAVLAGRHQDLRDVQHRLVKEVCLTAEGQVPLQTDGDSAGWLPATIEVVPGALQLMGLPSANSDSAPEWSEGAI
jgi:diacylglycerol kinase (ATP)